MKRKRPVCKLKLRRKLHVHVVAEEEGDLADQVDLAAEVRAHKGADHRAADLLGVDADLVGEGEAVVSRQWSVVSG